MAGRHLGREGAAAASLRPGRPDDAPALARIHRAARAAAMPGLREPWDEAAVAGWLREVLLARHLTLVAEAAGRPAGYLGLDVAAREVLHLYVAPAWQGRGLGRRLLREAAEAAPGGLSLHVFERNHAARRFYEGQGFRAAACRPAAANEEGEPDLLYVRPPAMPDPIEERRP